MEKTVTDPAVAALAHPGDVQWSGERPRSLVVCCSDGRLQKSVDDFLHNRLGVDDYDRLYAPGGPAALVDSSAEYTRAAIFRRDLEFLSKAHQIKQLILIFHGAADDGPEDAACAHYRRTLPGGSPADLARRQDADTAEALRYIAGAAPGLEVQVYRAEVQADRRVKFLNLAGARQA